MYKSMGLRYLYGTYEHHYGDSVKSFFFPYRLSLSDILIHSVIF